LTPVSLQFFVVVSVVVDVAEFAQRSRPRLGDDLTLFVRPPGGRVPPLVPGHVRHASVHPTRGAHATTGFPLSLRLLTELGGEPRLLEVEKLPKRFAASRHRRNTHVVVELAVRRT